MKDLLRKGDIKLLTGMTIIYTFMSVLTIAGVTGNFDFLMGGLV